MAYGNVSADRASKQQVGRKIGYKMAASKTIYRGSLVTLDSSGYATFATVGANLPFAGVALETRTSAAGENPKIGVAVEGVFSFVTSGATQALVGQEMYLDSGSSGFPTYVTSSDPGATELKVGVCVEVISATEVLVRINGYAGGQAKCGAS